MSKKFGQSATLPTIDQILSDLTAAAQASDAANTALPTALAAQTVANNNVVAAQGAVASANQLVQNVLAELTAYAASLTSPSSVG